MADDFRPGVNEDPQSEINRQAQGNYDIYIGVLGSKFGTSTSQAGSGTEEEFQIAISQFQQNTTSLRVFFYFKRANQDQFSIDIKQLETPKEEKLKNVAALRNFVATMVGVVAQITSFQEAVSNLPALTTKFSKARKHTASELGEIIAEIKLASDQGNDILQDIDESDN